ncbi:hypothetical protein Pmani_019783 [Petrolisthes manimaculis]|uniref:Integrin beta n=1 Tax=Petrolisthes manimaculis TaxID=1843537 RepID=A0AAE1NS24_9EUCA|nr:hypothetical protein Pmani_033054 [Petrolisthes manimaculis]KAK4308525.1 hypothetical protein Pmani_019783 [Petrolisthes manimaculis]
MVGVVTGQSECEDQETCALCIQTPGCVWCSKPKLPNKEAGEVVVHCRNFSHIPHDGSYCDLDHLENPTNDVHVILNKTLTAPTDRRTDEEIIQLAPQKIKLKLRKGIPQNIIVKYRLASGYPMDLYFLMDLTRSMNATKGTVARLGHELAILLESLTPQYRLGFGSFIDKVLMPYIDTSPGKIQNPCEDCAPPYAFRNDLPLTDNATLFIESVQRTKVSYSPDTAEGGLDGMMQAIVCWEKIGWRQLARKIIIYTTDAKFHMAGDGLLGGITAPSDEECHLNEAREYDAYDKYDYPSISQIDKVAGEHQINIIFAVSNHFVLYEQVSSLVQTSTFGRLDKEANNILNLVKEQYEKLSAKVQLTDNSSSEVSVEYSSRCGGNGPLKSTNKCDDIKSGDDIEFFLQVTATECPEDGKTRYIEVKTLQDTLILEIDFECSCSCNSTAENVVSAEECSKKGTLVCGACECDQGYIGKSCECNTRYLDFSEDYEDQIRKRCTAKEEDTEVCSGYGYCHCGKCVCTAPDVSGPYCNCNRRKCLTGEEEICSGHGSCQCNECQCEEGYSGTRCECPDSSNCIATGTEEVCSGHGDCNCGRCKCQQDESGNIYTGKFCEDCSTCTTKSRCVEYRDCVQCQSFHSGPHSYDGTCHTCNINTSFIDSLNGQQEKGARLCTFEDEDGCLFYFTYQYNSKLSPLKGAPRYDIFVQRERQCPTPPPVLEIMFGLIGSIVAVGVLTLCIWKVITVIHDRKELEKFEEDRLKAEWNKNDNPLYKNPDTTFQNPAFAQPH